jgi:hypothetical protein
MTSTTAQAHAAEATQAFHAAQADVQDATRRLLAHEARRPRAGATADQIKAWASEKGTLIAEVEVYEGIADEVRANAQQAHEAARAEQQANWYQERDRLADVIDTTVDPLVAEFNAAWQHMTELRQRIDAERQQLIDGPWSDHARLGEQLGIPFNEYQIRRVQGHGELLGPSWVIPRSGRGSPVAGR